MIAIIHGQAILFWGGWVSIMFLLSFSVSEGEGARGSQLTTMLKDHSHGERLKFLESSVCIRKCPKQETSNLLQYGISEEIRSNFCKYEKFPCCVFPCDHYPPLLFSFSVDHKFKFTSFQHWYKLRAFLTLIQVHPARSSIQRQPPPEKVLSRAIPSPGRALNY